MPLTEPKLDDRSFQELVDELKKRIPLYCPEWTDHNVSDPGVTLIELFAYLTEQLLYRMNQLPLLYYVKFAQFLGIPIPTPQPAHAQVTFYLSKPQTLATDPDNAGILIPAGTEVSTTQTETTGPTIFSTQTNSRIYAPRLSTLLRKNREDRVPQVLSHRPLLEGEGEGVDLFSTVPRVGDAFYFDFDNNLSNHVLSMKLVFEEKRGRQINIHNPPVVWEAFSENYEWEKIDGVNDTTKGLNAAGAIELFLPRLAQYSHQASTNGQLNDGMSELASYSIRVRVDRQEYDAAPRLLSIQTISALGITLATVHTERAVDEFLGVSDGSPGQRFPLAHGPIVLPLEPQEQIHVSANSVQQTNGNQHANQSSTWYYVENFAHPDSQTEEARKCFTIDVTTNEVRFGPAIQLSNGEVRKYGDIPPRGAELFFSRYRYGGSAANVASKQINRLKSSIPYVASVENRDPATGGQDALIASVENRRPSVRTHGILPLEALELQVQQFLQLRTGTGLLRAVTTTDYATLITARFAEHVAKVECREEYDATNQRATIVVYVIAKFSKATLGATAPNQATLNVSPQVIKEIDEFLYGCRLLGEKISLRFRVENPNYIRVNVQTTVAGAYDEEIQHGILLALSSYLDPVRGGPSGTGWALGQEVDRTKLEEWLQALLRKAQIRKIDLRYEAVGEQLVEQIVNADHPLQRSQLVIPGRLENPVFE